MPSTKSPSILRHQQQLAMGLIRSSATPQSTPVRGFVGFAIQSGVVTLEWVPTLYRLLVSTDQSSHTFSEWSSLRFSISACDNFRNEVETPPVKILPRSFTFQTNPVVIAHITWCRLLTLLLLLGRLLYKRLVSCILYSCWAVKIWDRSYLVVPMQPQHAVVA